MYVEELCDDPSADSDKVIASSSVTQELSELFGSSFRRYNAVVHDPSTWFDSRLQIASAPAHASFVSGNLIEPDTRSLEACSGSLASFGFKTLIYPGCWSNSSAEW